MQIKKAWIIFDREEKLYYVFINHDLYPIIKLETLEDARRFIDFIVLIDKEESESK